MSIAKEKQLSAAALLVAFLWPSCAEAAPICRDHKGALEVLKQRYREVPVAQGVDANGDLFQILATENGTTWTAIVTRPGGRTCIIWSGKNWIMEKAPNGEKT